MKTTQEYQDFSEQHWRNYTPSDSLPANISGYGAILLKAWDEHQATQATQPEKEELVEFNLEEALQEPERVRFRNGETPLDWHYFDQLHDKTFPIVAIKAHEQRVNITKDGFFMKGGNKDDYDLMLVKKKQVVWFGLYEDINGILNTTGVYNDKDLTKRYCEANKLKLLKPYSYEL